MRTVDPEPALQRLVDGLVTPDEVPAGGALPPAGASLTVRAPGLDVAVAAGDRQVRGLGGEVRLPFTVGTAVDLASVTKAVATSTAILALLQAGVIGLDDPVGRYVPQFTVAPKDRVVLRDLLLHRGGSGSGGRRTAWLRTRLRATTPSPAWPCGTCRDQDATTPISVSSCSGGSSRRSPRARSTVLSVTSCSGRWG